MNDFDLNVPAIFLPLFSSEKRYNVLYGGRGSGKSHIVATYLLAQAMKKPTRILCCREIQNSIKDSVHKLLEDKIGEIGFDNFFTVKHDSIVGSNGSLFIFKGLQRNSSEIKSTEGLDYAWVEEAQSVSSKSLEILTPTVRKEGSQILFTMNPTNDDDPVYVDWVLREREDTLKIKANYIDNAFFPSVLDAEKDYCKKVDYDKYRHIWQGETVKHSEAQVFFGKWNVEDFQFDDVDFYYFGADWGFSADPTCLIRSFIKGKTLYIDYEAWGVGVDTNNIPEMFDTVPLSRKYPIIADSARPETISAVRQAGFQIQGARKGKGSVEDGISFLRSFEKIYIHPRCKNTIYEFQHYQYKVDKKTGLISTIIEDRNNHCLDGLRYSLEPIMTKNKGTANNITGW